MNCFSLFGLLLAGGLGAGLAQANELPCDDSPVWISMEIHASEVASEEPARLVQVSENGCTVVRFASFDRRQGVYWLPADPSRVKQLAAHWGNPTRRQALELDQAKLAKAVPAGSDAWANPCGDVYRVAVLDPKTNKAGAVTWHAQWQDPLVQAEAQGTKSTSKLVAALQQLRKLTESPDKQRVVAQLNS